MMKRFSKSFLKFVAVFAGLVAFCHVTSAQETKPAESGRLKPAQVEKFVNASDLIIPWRSVSETCWALTPNPKPNCRVVTDVEFRAADFLTLYNSDDSLWYQFSVEPRDPRYYLGSPKRLFRPVGKENLEYYPEGWTKSEFKPLGPEIQINHNKTLYHLDLVILRLFRESPNWYEVEINEETRETKFIAKTDPLWTKVTWGDIFNMSFNVSIDPEQTKILDKPDGKPIAGCTDKHLQEHTFSKLDGDWMLVNGATFSNKSCMGWIRWRNGRNILVGSILNGRKVPKVKINETL